MSSFFDYDPVSGIRHDFDYDEATGNAIIHTTQDVQAVLDHNKALANDGLTDKGIKKGWWLYAKIPLVVLLKMRTEKGINAFDPRHSDRVVAEINEHYPWLKTTQKHMGGKPTMIHDLGKR